MRPATSVHVLLAATALFGATPLLARQRDTMTVASGTAPDSLPAATPAPEAKKPEEPSGKALLVPQIVI